MRQHEKFKGWTFLIFPVIVSIFAGCAAVGPNYSKPEITVSEQWRNELKGIGAGGQEPKDIATWWKRLSDPVLSGLIERAVAGNLDLKKARSTVRESRARRSLAASDFFPKMDAVGSYNKSRSSKETGRGGEADLFSAGLDSSWELDIFGGVRRSVEAAKGDLQASEEDLRDVLVSLAAEVGLNYVEARAFQMRLAVSEKNLEAQEETYQLTQSRFQAGVGTELAVQQAKYNLESTRSQIPALRTGLEEALNRLAVLVGEQPGAAHAELEEAKPIPVAPLELALGIPADILRQRPDIRRAERELAAQTARVGVAVAELYPKLTMKGSITLDALTFSNLFSAGSRASSFGPSLSIPLFKGGAIRSNIEVQSALQEQALIAYEAKILEAVEEVENGLKAYMEEQNKRQALDRATDAARKAAILAEQQFNAGQVDFSNVLDAQRSLLTFEDQLAESNGAVVSNLIRIYKALGGGWTTLAPETADKG